MDLVPSAAKNSWVLLRSWCDRSVAFQEGLEGVIWLLSWFFSIFLLDKQRSTCEVYIFRDNPLEGLFFGLCLEWMAMSQQIVKHYPCTPHITFGRIQSFKHLRSHIRICSYLLSISNPLSFYLFRKSKVYQPNIDVYAAVWLCFAHNQNVIKLYISMNDVLTVDVSECTE